MTSSTVQVTDSSPPPVRGPPSLPLVGSSGSQTVRHRAEAQGKGYNRCECGIKLCVPAWPAASLPWTPRCQVHKSARRGVQLRGELLPQFGKNTFLGKKEKFSPYSSVRWLWEVTHHKRETSVLKHARFFQTYLISNSFLTTACE